MKDVDLLQFDPNTQPNDGALRSATHAHDVGGESWSEHSPREEVIWQKMPKSSSVWEFSFHAWSSRFSKARKRRLNEARWGEKREVLPPSLPSFLFGLFFFTLQLLLQRAHSGRLRWT